jgi:hypothetical protein
MHFLLWIHAPRFRACNASQKTDVHTVSADLNTWLAEAGASGMPVIETFAAGLQGDGGAIGGALTTLWSNGQTEGQVIDPAAIILNEGWTPPRLQI